MNKIRRIDFFFLKTNIDDSRPSEPTPMCNVEVMVEQLQCASIYKKNLRLLVSNLLPGLTLLI
jgi:hypothetical protein